MAQTHPRLAHSITATGVDMWRIEEMKVYSRSLGEMVGTEGLAGKKGRFMENFVVATQVINVSSVSP